MKPLNLALPILLTSAFAISASANSCPTGSSATIDQAYAAMKTGTHWVDQKNMANGGGKKTVGIVFEKLNKSKGFKESKGLYTHGKGIFKIDYFTSAKARYECRRQIDITGKNSDGSFKGFLIIDTCAPDSIDRAAAELDKLDSFGGKISGKANKIQGIPNNDNPVRIRVKMDKLKFVRKESDAKYGAHCLMDIKMSTTIGGSAKAYKWRLRDSAPNFTGRLTYFGNDGKTYGYTP